MKMIWIAFVSAVIALTMVIADADAKKRFGGGSNKGMQRDSAQQQQQQQTPPTAAPASPAAPTNAAAPAAAKAPAATPQPSGMSRWMGPIAGLLAGTALGALLMNSGMGGLIGVLLMALLIGAVVFFAIRMLRGGGSAQATPRTYPQAEPQPAYAGNSNGPLKFLDDKPVGSASTASGGSPAASSGARNIPADFDVEPFVKNAKKAFIQLQAANDTKDVSGLRDFMTPELYAEIAPEIMNREGDQRVDIVQLNADVLEVVQENNRWVASVRFSGLLREEGDSAPESFTEMWHVVKPVSGSGSWMLAGIQQV